MINPNIEGKTVLVTGANHGIGAATALAFAQQKTKVFITFLRIKESPVWRNDEYQKKQVQNANEIVEKIKSINGIVENLEVDLSKETNISILFDDVERKLGPVDILINNAAYCVPDTFKLNKKGRELSTGAVSESFSAQSHDLHFAVNSKATSLMMKEYVSRYIKRNASWGRIINVSTDAADCFPTEISYGASKAALESYSKSAAVELGKYGITVNIVAPGPIQTGWMTKDVEELQAKKSSLGRIGKPDDIADVIVFLASDQARWLTGQKLYVGGGNRVV